MAKLRKALLLAEGAKEERFQKPLPGIGSPSGDWLLKMLFRSTGGQDSGYSKAKEISTSPKRERWPLYLVR